jgi:hypothetical protein
MKDSHLNGDDEKGRLLMYYKGFDANLCGYHDYPFEVGRTYSTDIDDTWSWYHYTRYISATINYFEGDMRICEVEPLGETRRFRDALDGFGKGYFTTNKLRIVRELSRDEVFDILLAEKCPLFLIKKLNPPFEVLMQYKNQIRGDRCHWILSMAHLTDEQKRDLLPKVWHRYIRYFGEERAK